MPYPFVTFSAVSNATTASPGLVTMIISPSPKLRAIVRAVVRLREATRDVLQVYRVSSSAPGMWSCDEYAIVDGKLGPRRERPEKYWPSQLPPPGAKCRPIDGASYYTLHDMTDAEADELHRLVASLTT